MAGRKRLRAPSCQELAYKLRSLDEPLDWKLCLPGWKWKQSKWVTDLQKIEKIASQASSDEAAVVKQIAKLAISLHESLKPEAVSTWFSGSTAEEWHTQAEVATDTVALEQLVSALELAMNMGPVVPAWLAASASPPAPTIDGVQVKPAPATPAPPKDTATIKFNPRLFSPDMSASISVSINIKLYLYLYFFLFMSICLSINIDLSFYTYIYIYR